MFFYKDVLLKLAVPCLVFLLSHVPVDYVHNHDTFYCIILQCSQTGGTWAFLVVQRSL